MAYIDKISVNGSERDLRDAGAARFDETQALTDAQKQAARANVGAASAADVTALTATVATKADAADVTALAETVNGKASAADMTALAGRVTTAEGDIDGLEAAVDTKADAADVTALATVVAGKVDTEQGVSYAGKALVVGSDGLVTPGDAGVPAAVAEALLACFQKVAWVDATGQALYDALYAALYGSEPTPSPVPSEYTAYDYIGQSEYDGDIPYARALFTLRYANCNNKIIDFYYKTISAITGTTAPVFGTRILNADGNGYINAFYTRTDTGRVSCFSHGAALGINDTDVVKLNEIVHVRLEPGAATPAKLIVGTNETTATWVNSYTNPGRFGYGCTWYDNGTFEPGDTTGGVYGKVQLGIFRMYELDGTLAGEYYPCVRNADNVIGIYDTVSNTFVTTYDPTYATIGHANCRFNVGNWEA